MPSDAFFIAVFSLFALEVLARFGAWALGWWRRVMDLVDDYEADDEEETASGEHP